ncbi:MAG: SUMF1/EgtB/PvdO family nonheme iron enzyme [Acidobacteriota bacterium]|nr:SUMF1/EgtB/PvdO family nonheme iron enzyme [Acidobacteriota bacterium]
MQHNAFPRGVTKDALIDWYRALRARTRSLFELVVPDAYYDRPIALRNPIVFYEGHFPGFAVNTLVKLTLGAPGVDEGLELLFARGIDPEDETAVRSPADVWPSRETVHAFGRESDALIERTLRTIDIDAHAEAIFTILEHEAMHHETLLYMLHELSYAKKVRPANAALTPSLPRVSRDLRMIPIPRGIARLGAPRSQFGWDNEFPQHDVDVPEFAIDPYNVTNGEWLEYMTATGASAPHFWTRGENEWCWRGMFEALPLDLDAPVYVTHDEAAAFARWKGKRLPSEAQFHRAAFGDDDGPYPWGDAPPDRTRGNFDFASFEPVPVGSYPNGVSPFGVHDLVGNGWEWTSTVFDGFDGFAPMRSYPQYSIDFFDGKHYVMKGASPATDRTVVRRSFRNWFRPNYPYVYATFRCVASVSS